MSRIKLPENATRVCARCLAPRGNVRRGWEPYTRNGVVLGWTCANCPRVDEPIERAVSRVGIRFRTTANFTDAEGNYQQRQRSFITLDEARAWLAEMKEGAALPAKNGGRFTDASTLTVRQIVDKWLASRAAEVGTPGGIRSETANGYASALASPLALIGERVARELTTDDVEAMLRTLVTVGGIRKRPLAHRSAQYALLALRMAFDYAMRQRPKWLTENVASSAKLPGRIKGKAPSTRRLRWSPAELVAFRAHVDSRYADSGTYAAEPWAASGMRLTLCGLRRSEVLGLDWTGVDLDTGAVAITASRTKTGRGNATELNSVKTDNSERVVQADKVHPGTAKALRALWLAQGRPESGLVFRDALGQPVHPDLYSRRFRALRKAAGVPHLARIHNVRHSLATALQDAGVPDNQAAALLGHDVDTYRRFYLVTDDDGAAEAAEAAGLLFAV